MTTLLAEFLKVSNLIVESDFLLKAFLYLRSNLLTFQVADIYSLFLSFTVPKSAGISEETTRDFPVSGI